MIEITKVTSPMKDNHFSKFNHGSKKSPLAGKFFGAKTKHSTLLTPSQPAPITCPSSMTYSLPGYTTSHPVG